MRVSPRRPKAGPPTVSARSSRRDARARPMRTPDELRTLVEGYLGELALTPELHGQAESVRYAIASPGKRVRPVILLATAEGAGAEAERALPAAAAIELVH